MHKHIKYTNTYTHARRQTYMGDKHTYKQYIQADMPRFKHTYRDTYIQTGRQGQSYMQTGIHTYRPTYRQT